MGMGDMCEKKRAPPVHCRLKMFEYKTERK